MELERSARASSVQSRRLSRTTQETERKQINKHYFPSKRRKQAGAARSLGGEGALASLGWTKTLLREVGRRSWLPPDH